MRADGVKTSKSCGCLTKEVASSEENITRLRSTIHLKKPKDDVLGAVLGRLTVSSIAPPKYTPLGVELIYYYANCSCGKTEVLVSRDAVLAKSKSSCGCIQKKDVYSKHLDKTSVYLEQLNKIHGDKYDFSKVAYTTYDEKVLVTCYKHGEFRVKMSNLLNGGGCRKCGSLSGRTKDPKSTDETENFILRSKEVFGDTYSYSGLVYLGNKYPVTITCPQHGEFTQQPATHLRCKVPCPTCRKEDRSLLQDSWISKFKAIHGDLYDYSKVIFKRGSEPVEIVCSSHGSFTKSPSNHVNGAGCQKCSCEVRSLKQHWNYLKRCDLDEDLANSTGTVYLLKMKTPTEEFLKIGISSNFKKRIQRYSEVGIGFTKLVTIDCERIKQAAIFEKEILDEVRGLGFRYLPSTDFKGYTECADVLYLDEVIEMFLKRGGVYVRG
jgi:hypothetical protein